jgi:hypothetical protein
MHDVHPEDALQNSRDALSANYAVWPYDSRTFNPITAPPD